MALSVDTATRWPAAADSTDSTAGDRTVSHAGGANPKGVVVTVLGSASNVLLTGINYGVSSMGTYVQYVSDTSELGRIYQFFLADPPAGTQTVTFLGCSTAAKWAVITTLNADSTTTRYVAGGVAGLSTQGPNTTRSLTVAPTNGASAMAFGGMHDGNAEPPTTSGGTYTYDTNCQIGVTDGYCDYGTRSAESIRSTNPETDGSITLSWTTSINEDWCMAIVAIEEYPATAPWTLPDPPVYPSYLLVQ